MKTATPTPMSAARPPTSVNSSTRSISMSPESARPGVGGYLDAGVPAFGQFGAGARVAFDERTDRAQRRVRVRMSQLAHRRVQGGPHRTPDSLIRPRLELAGAPARAHRSRSQRVEQHRLADPAQAGEHHRPLGSAACDPFEHDIEGVQLLVASGELGGTLTGARGVGVADRVHARTLFGCLVLMEEARISGSKVHSSILRLLHLGHSRISARQLYSLLVQRVFLRRGPG